jgi:hypothetical protein
VPTDATAFVHRDERFVIQHLVTIGPDAPTIERDAARGWLARSWALVHRWGSGGVYPNFPDPDLQDWTHAYYGNNYDRPLRVKAGTTRQVLPLPPIASRLTRPAIAAHDRSAVTLS